MGSFIHRTTACRWYSTIQGQVRRHTTSQQADVQGQYTGTPSDKRLMWMQVLIREVGSEEVERRERGNPPPR
jgi:hypothetical protein